MRNRKQQEQQKEIHRVGKKPSSVPSNPIPVQPSSRFPEQHIQSIQVKKQNSDLNCENNHLGMIQDPIDLS
jgi:hypothetical protein